jgi:LCP family protein required for cell wall assembly
MSTGSGELRLRPRSSGGGQVAIQHRHGKPRRPAVARYLLSALAVVLVATLSVTTIVVWATASKIKPGIELTDADGNVADPPSVGALEGGANILLVGTDTRTDQGGEFSTEDQLDGSSGVGSNDVTMVLHISADNTNAAVISIPRDLETPVPECPDPAGGDPFSAKDQAMFNTTLSEGGLSCVVLTAEQLTGLDIEYAATIDFDGVIAMSDAVGGVTVCLASAVDDDSSNLHLAAGNQTLSGADALAFVRTRYGVGDGSDLGRISNQQVFLSALLRQITSQGVLTNPVTLYKLANAAAASIQPSQSLASPVALASIALALAKVSLENIVFLQYPTVTDPDDPNRVIADSYSVDALIAALASGAPLQLTGTLGVGAVEGTPTAEPAPTPTATGDSTSSPVAVAPPVELPSTISGQPASQETCTKANE